MTIGEFALKYFVIVLHAAFQKYQDSLTNPWLSVFRKIIEATKNNNTPSGLEIIWEATQKVISQNQASLVDNLLGTFTCILVVIII